jgi:hypothetical protein
MQSSCDYVEEGTLSKLGALLVALAALCSGACSADDEDDGHSHHGPCAEIEELCADKDDGTPGVIADCHQLAHEGSTQRCEAQHAACLQACQ